MPKAEAIVIPVFIPTEGGVGDLVLGEASVGESTLVIEFNNKLPSVAILRAIQRGEIIGVTFVAPALQEAAEEAAKEELTQDERDARDLELLQSDEDIDVSKITD